MVQEAGLITIICGPTGVGKTAAGIALAQKIGGEIVSADSGQIYRGMDIGTAKPSLQDQEKVPFHLIDILNPDQKFSAADFRARTVKIVEEIQSRGKKTIIVGGTGLYLKALEGGLFEGPAADLQIRQELEERIQEEGIEPLYRELQKVDPVAAAGIPPKNRQRLIRALEVYQLTGRPISQFWKEHQDSRGAPWRAQEGAASSTLTFQKFGLSLPKEELYRRLDERVDRMIADGLVGEVRHLLRDYSPAAPGLRIIGYKEIAGFLQGELSQEEAVELVKRHTRQYAKRQMTWFKKDPDIRWENPIDKNEYCS
jgi:tRNA dimethylallyltransferase